MAATPATRIPKTKPGSHLERAFRLWIRQEGLPPAEEQHRFHPTRKWLFDFAWPDSKIAVEIDGLVHSGKGAHQTVQGILADAEKNEAALRAGWKVYRVPGQWIATGSRLIWRPEVIETLRDLLEDQITGREGLPRSGT